MSPRARRLTGPAETGRFPWQTEPPPVRALARLPLRALSDAPPPSTGSPQDIRLPTVNVDRIAAVEQAAFAEGYAAGEQAGQAVVAARAQELLDRLASTIAEVSALRAQIMRSADRDLVRLAIAMAERIVRFRLRLNQRLLLFMAQAAVDRLGENVTATVALNPADFDRLPLPGEGLGALQVVADPAVAPGGCLIRSAAGAIDAGVDAQVRELATALLGSDEHFNELASHAASGE